MQFKGDDSISEFFTSTLETMMETNKYAMELDTMIGGQALTFVIVLTSFNGIPMIPEKEEKTIDMVKSEALH